MRARIPSAEACRSRRRMTRRWICRMLSLREITRSPSRSHFSGMGGGTGEGSLHLFVPIRVWGGHRLARARLELRAWPRIEFGVEVLLRD